MTIPETKSPISGLDVDLDGRIWVALNVESTKFDSPTESQGIGPQVHYRASEQRWDVYAPTGHYLGNVRAGLEFKFYTARGNRVWGVQRDADDVATLDMFRLQPGW